MVVRLQKRPGFLEEERTRLGFHACLMEHLEGTQFASFQQGYGQPARLLGLLLTEIFEQVQLWCAAGVKHLTVLQWPAVGLQST